MDSARVNPISSGEVIFVSFILDPVCVCLSVCVCMCMCVYMCVYVYVYVCVCVCVYISVLSFARASECARISVCL